MNQTSIKKKLDALPLGKLRYFDSIGSTNDFALAWATQQAPDLSLVIANEQTQGRGSAGRKWATPPGSALALSLILRPHLTPSPSPCGRGEPVSLLTGLGALALVDALKTFGLSAQIKWPNDVLINGKKCAGILVESVWTGDALDASVLGMGVNVLAASTPPASELLFPATSVEHELGHSLDRRDLLKELLASLLAWRGRLGGGGLVKAWEESLAFIGEPVWVENGSGARLEGRIAGLESDGSLRLRTMDDTIVTVHFGEMRLRPTL